MEGRQVLRCWCWRPWHWSPTARAAPSSHSARSPPGRPSLLRTWALARRRSSAPGGCFSPGGVRPPPFVPAPHPVPAPLRQGGGAPRRCGSALARAAVESAEWWWGRGRVPCLFAPPGSQSRLRRFSSELPGLAALASSAARRLLCATAAVPAPTCAWPQPRTRRTRPHWPSRSCCAASSVAGAAARRRYPGEGLGGRAVPAELPGLQGGLAASPPLHPNGFGERSPGRAPLQPPLGLPPCPAGASRAGPRPSGEEAASGGRGMFATEGAAAARDSCPGHLNASLQSVNNAVFCTSLHKSASEQSWRLWTACGFFSSLPCQNIIRWPSLSASYWKEKNTFESVKRWCCLE